MGELAEGRVARPERVLASVPRSFLYSLLDHMTKKTSPRQGQGRARNRIKGKEGSLVQRKADGTFEKWVGLHRSIDIDAGKHSENRPKKPGHGNEGDYKKKRPRRPKRK